MPIWTRRHSKSCNSTTNAVLLQVNAHVRDKIRQQLQVLRDLGLLTFLGSGFYRLT